jgi:tetratricopeptide (TPR) repeat protein
MREQQIVEWALGKATPAEQRAYLDEACGGDAALRQRVEKLLNAQEGTVACPAGPGTDVPATPPAAADPTAVLLSSTAAGGDPAETRGAPPDAGGQGLAFLQPSARPGVLGRLGHYEVLEVLGKGAFGIVLKARDERLGRLVAVKVLGPQLAGNAEARRRFVREARAAAAVRDPHVVGVFDVEEEPLPYLVMEYVRGRSLQERLDEGGPLEVPEIVRIGAEVARGLAAAHRRGEVHRDVKPANILLESPPPPIPFPHEVRGEERAKLTDFGLAKAIDDASLTQSGTIIGTPLYMSPEQARGEALDSRSDLFSLGSVLYTLCTGQPPFRATRSLGVLKRVCEDTPPPIPEINPRIPSLLAAIIGKLLAKYPGERFQSAAEVADLLGQYLAHLRDPSLPPPAVEFGLNTAVYGPPVGKAAGEPAADTHLRHAPPKTALALPHRLSGRRWQIGVAAAGVAILVAGIAIVVHVLRPVPADDTGAGGEAVEVAGLKEVVAGHQQEAGRLLRAGRAEEALGRLGQALAAIDLDAGADAGRNALRWKVYRQRAAVLRRLGRGEEADGDGRQARARLELAAAGQPDDLEAAEALAEMLLAEPAVRWTVVRPAEMTSGGGAVLKVQPDGSVLASGPNPDTDLYTLSAADLPPSVAAVRLEVLADPALPNKGPGRHPTGNFQLAEITFYRLPAGAAAPATPLPIARGATDYAYEAELLERAFDDDPLTRWHVWGRIGQDHWAIFQLRKAVSFGAGDRLVVRLEHCRLQPLTNLGRFRLSVSADPQAPATEPLQAALRQAGLRGLAALGAAWFCHGEFGKAVGPLTRAVQARPDAARELLLALTRQGLKQGDQARPLYDRAMKQLAQQPPDATTTLLLPRALGDIEGLGAAEADARLTAKAEARELAALTAALETKADKAAGLADRAAFYACRGRWKECVRDHLARVALKPEDWLVWLPPAAALVLAGDAEEHRRLCRRMAGQFPLTQNPYAAEAVIKASLLRPGSIDAAELPLQTLEMAVDRGEVPGGLLPWANATLGLAAYRAGDHPKAVRRANEAQQEQIPECRALALVVRALAEHHLHHPAEARQSFAEASALLPPEVRMLGTPDNTHKQPVNSLNLLDNRLIAEVLRREAEGLLFPDLPAFLAGKHQPRDAGEQLALAVACRARGLNRVAAGLYADAFAADARLAEDRRAGHRYAAACCAIRSWAAVNLDAPQEQERALRSRQALGWLQEELAALTRQQAGTPEDRRGVRQAVQSWLRDTDLALVRDPCALALLPAGDRPAWSKWWADVVALPAVVPAGPK